MIEVKTIGMEHLRDVAIRARERARESNETVFFNFNGVKIHVNADTSIGILRRDHEYSCMLGWSEIPEEQVFFYPVDTEFKALKWRIKNDR